MVARRFEVQHNDSNFDLAYDTDDGFEVFQFQLFSLTSVPPDHQKIYAAEHDTPVASDSDLITISEKLKLISINETQAEPESSNADLLKSDEEFARLLQPELKTKEMRKGGNGSSLRSGSQSSRVHGSENQSHFPMFCTCLVPQRVVYRISRTLRNPRRPFIACPLPKKAGGCGFFWWIDQLPCFNMADGSEEEEGIVESKLDESEEMWKTEVMSKLDEMEKDVRGLKLLVLLICFLVSVCLVLLFGRNND